MSKVGVGLDIGSSGVRIAAIRQGRRGAGLVAYGRVALDHDENPVEPADPDQITATVKLLMKQEKIPQGMVCIGLSDQRIVARQVDLPWIPANEFATALPLLASDLLPMPVEDSVLDFLPFDEFVDDEGARTLRGLLVAANASFVEATVEAVERGGLRVDRVDFGPLGALRASCDPTPAVAEAVLDLGDSGTSLVVHEGSRPTFVRVMSQGGRAVTELLATELGLTQVQAESWKLAVAGMWPTMSRQDQQRTHEVLDRAVAPLVDEIRSSLAFQRTNSDIRVSKVFLTGGAAAQFGLDLQLRQALQTVVVRATPVQRLGAGLSKNAAARLQASEAETATAIGLALAVAA